VTGPGFDVGQAASGYARGDQNSIESTAEDLLP
jgi:hypothetical protein